MRLLVFYPAALAAIWLAVAAAGTGWAIVYGLGALVAAGAILRTSR